MKDWNVESEDTLQLNNFINADDAESSSSRLGESREYREW